MLVNSLWSNLRAHVIDMELTMLDKRLKEPSRMERDPSIDLLTTDQYL